MQLRRQHFSRQRVDLEPTFAQDRQPVVPLQHGTIRPGLQRTGLSWLQRPNKISRRTKPKLRELHRTQGRLRVQEPEQWFQSLRELYAGFFDRGS